jgi:hypothetical protein
MNVCDVADYTVPHIVLRRDTMGGTNQYSHKTWRWSAILGAPDLLSLRYQPIGDRLRSGSRCPSWRRRFPKSGVSIIYSPTVLLSPCRNTSQDHERKRHGHPHRTCELAMRWGKARQSSQHRRTSPAMSFLHEESTTPVAIFLSCLVSVRGFMQANRSRLFLRKQRSR